MSNDLRWLADDIDAHVLRDIYHQSYGRRMEEWHITVEGDQHVWRGFCASIGIKALHIELNTFERQLMCAIPGTWLTNEYGSYVPAADAIVALHSEMSKKGFRVVRVKHEVACRAYDVVPDALYYEVHCKFDGPFKPALRMTSRDLFRNERWYLTQRKQEPFDPQFIAGIAGIAAGSANRLDSFEYEACVLDTNPHLDAEWVRR